MVRRGLESGRLHSDSRVAPGSACGGCMLLICLFCFEVEEEQLCRPPVGAEGTVVGSTT